MEISINGKPADIVLETEKNIGDVLGGLEQWLTGSDLRLSGLAIDGQKINAPGIEEAMVRELEGIHSLDILISSWEELALEALADLGQFCVIYGDSSFEERKDLGRSWEQSAAAAFLSAEIDDLYNLSVHSFSGTGLTPENLGILAEERLRELADPGMEIYNIEKPVSVIAARMEELPLDIQTGKDGRAAETIQLFSQMGEKLFRLLRVFTKQGFSMESVNTDGGFKGFLDDFGAALGELTAAYKNQDAVLAGDLAEYELAPRLQKLYCILKDYTQRDLAQNNKSPEEARKGL